ncbi:MAG: hypothetical protein LBR81_02805 [Prevotellaceae bacterium]|jgi:hypothetical protein|nr:hypothetical protein [Prevotellaceae bacterium]
MTKNIFTNNCKVNLFKSKTKHSEFIFDISIQCSKFSISTEIENIDSFPRITFLKEQNEELLYDRKLLVKIQEKFDSISNTEQIDSLAKTIALNIKSNINTHNRKGLAKKKSKQKRIINDALKIFKEKWTEKESSEFSYSFKIYLATINTYYLFYPPNKISKKRFQNILSKVIKDSDKETLNKVYKLDCENYCAKNRLNKKNYKDIARIIVETKKHT